MGDDKQQPKYTQVVDEKSGEIKFVPDTPPQPTEGESQAGEGNLEDQAERLGVPKGPEEKEVLKAMNGIEDELPNSVDDELVSIIKEIEANNKKLRYDTRIHSGKLDGRRLTAYKTSDRLFKKKAIKHRDYQFTIMLDTSGSMFGGKDGHEHNDLSEQLKVSKLGLAIKSIDRIARALEAADLPVSVVAMNIETRMLKRFDEKWQKGTFFERLNKNLLQPAMDGGSNMGGTAEQIAYTHTVDYIRRNTVGKKENVVFVLSDGEPGCSDSQIRVYIDDDENATVVERDHSDRTDSLKRYWEQQHDLKPYGIGIMSAARQIPRAQQLDEPSKLAGVMRNLIQEILL